MIAHHLSLPSNTLSPLNEFRVIHFRGPSGIALAEPNPSCGRPISSWLSPYSVQWILDLRARRLWIISQSEMSCVSHRIHPLYAFGGGTFGDYSSEPDPSRSYVDDSDERHENWDSVAV
jgi:hypothetical protein